MTVVRTIIYRFARIVGILINIYCDHGCRTHVGICHGVLLTAHLHITLACLNACVQLIRCRTGSDTTAYLIGKRKRDDHKSSIKT